MYGVMLRVGRLHDGLTSSPQDWADKHGLAVPEPGLHHLANHGMTLVLRCPCNWATCPQLSDFC